MRALLSRLWVRNAVGAVVAAAAIAVIVFTSLGDSWTTYRRSVVPGAVVPVGQSGDAEGYTWKIKGSKYLNRSPRTQEKQRTGVNKFFSLSPLAPVNLGQVAVALVARSILNAQNRTSWSKAVIA